MSFTIHKHEITDSFETIKFLPENAVILSLGMQGESIVFWALVDDSRSLEERRFRIFGTGWTIGVERLDKLKFVGTVQTPTGLVWHVFELVR